MKMEASHMEAMMIITVQETKATMRLGKTAWPFLPEGRGRGMDGDEEGH
jgi:hypothetical protein